MAASPSFTPLRNRLLELVPPDEFERIAPYLQKVSLDLKQALYRFREPIHHVYFPLSGIISAMTVMEDGAAIEVATIGNEGFAGITVLVGGETAPHELMVQVQGDAVRMESSDFSRLVGESVEFRRILTLYHTAFSTQVSYSVACNGLHPVEKRCSRWLLMTQDRVGADLLPLTHEFLAIMLGVRRATITDVLRPFQDQGIIENSRGTITILDRPALEARACECYRAVNQEFTRLFG